MHVSRFFHANKIQNCGQCSQSNLSSFSFRNDKSEDRAVKRNRPVTDMAETGSVVTKPRDESTINEHVLHDYIAGAVGGMLHIPTLQSEQTTIFKLVASTIFTVLDI